MKDEDIISITNSKTPSIEMITDIDEIRNQLKKLDSYFILQNIPSFGDLTINYPFSLQKLIDSLYQIINIKAKDDETKTRLREDLRQTQINKEYADKQVLRSNSINNDQNNKIFSLEKQIQKLTQKLEENEKNFKEEKATLEESKNKIERRLSEFDHKYKKKEKEYETLQLKYEKLISKEMEKNDKFSKNTIIVSSKPNIDISYYKVDGNAIPSIKNISEEINKWHDMKFKDILIDNEKMKSLILNLNKEACSYVTICKDYFLKSYKNVFGVDFECKDGVSLEPFLFAEKGVLVQINPAACIKEVFDTIKANFDKTKGFIKKNFELKHIIMSTVKKEGYNENLSDNNSNSKPDDNTLINNYYKEITNELLKSYNTILNNRKENYEINNLCSLYEKIDLQKALAESVNIKEVCNTKLESIYNDFTCKYSNDINSINSKSNKFLESIKDIKQELEEYKNMIENSYNYNIELEKRMMNK